MGKILVATGLESKKKIELKELLFLGDWCLNNNIDTNRFDVVNYHWNDRKKLFQDYKKLERVYELFLQILSDSLNKYHCKNLPISYWRILIGPWLETFIHTIFDRWEMMNKANKEYKINSMLSFINPKMEYFIPYDFDDYYLKIKSHNWNQFIYTYIGEFININQIESIELSLDNFKKRNYKNDFIKLCNVISNKINSKKNIFIYSRSIDFKSYLQMQFLLKQFPTIWNKVLSPRIFPNMNSRSKLLKGIKFDQDSFCKLLVNLIPIQIPTIYLEGFLELNEYSRIFLPSSSKLVVDSIAWFTDDVFKNWIALKKISSNTKYIISQHGGNYGTSLFNSTEEHQISISDSFLSWGWKDKRSKVLNLGTFNYQKQKILKKQKKIKLKIILIQGLNPKYSNFIFASPISTCQWRSYLNDQERFIKLLDKDIKKSLTIKLYKNNFQYDEELFFRKSFPNVKIYSKPKSLLNIINSFSIVVATYNATTFLETLMINFPTIIFWNNNHWELRDESKSFFNKLRQVGIFHDSSDSAAEFINRVSNDISGWWFSKELQIVREEFVKNYAKKITLKELSDHLKNYVEYKKK